MKSQTRTLTVTLSALVFLLLSASIVYAANEGNEQSRAAWRASLTEEQREILDEVRELHQRGDHEEARELMESAGIAPPEHAQHRGMSSGRHAHHAAIHQAIEDGDYEAFLELTEDSPREIEIDEETFNKLVEAHALREEGDHEGARAILDEIGLRPGHGHHRQPANE